MGPTHLAPDYRSLRSIELASYWMLVLPFVLPLWLIAHGMLMAATEGVARRWALASLAAYGSVGAMVVALGVGLDVLPGRSVGLAVMATVIIAIGTGSVCFAVATTRMRPDLRLLSTRSATGRLLIATGVLVAATLVEVGWEVWIPSPTVDVQVSPIFYWAWMFLYGRAARAAWEVPPAFAQPRFSDPGTEIQRA